ncbi:long-chain fatty acid--CoA ligase [Nonomuraea sp. NPDC050536]|uniref:long-chain fatty acid--CoA ligase n=1 Tax=Nonomuraea sp. NPDC050536 TaxID=3364366 RepID=UPI0037C86DA9
MYLTLGLHRALQQRPHAPFTITRDRGRTVAECADRVARLAGALVQLGVAKDDRVGILSLNSDRFHEYLFAVPWADAVIVPVNFRWSPTEIATSLEESGTAVLFVDDTFAPLVPALREQWPGLRTVIHCGDGTVPGGTLPYEDLVADAKPIPDARRGGGQLAGIFYTGGTTGSPKGVMLSHANIITSALGSSAAGHFVTPGGRLLHVAPLFHLAGLGAWVAGNLVGTTHIVLPTFDPAATARALAEYQATDVLMVPTMMHMLVNDPTAHEVDLSAVRRLIYGASHVSEPTLRAIEKIMPNATLTQAYGMTELAPVATLLQPTDHADPTLRTSAGRAAPHAEVRIVDPAGNEVPRGQTGEVVVRGAHVMLGYWNRPEETAHALRDGWMHTGDAGRMDDNGYVYIVDRIKDMIITGGENVYSAEVEAVLATHPAIDTCAVVGVPDPDWGERVHAVVVPKPGTHLTGAELREYCKTRIAGYKSPRSIQFVDQLPISAAGKILKRTLRDQYRERPEHLIG